MLLAASDAVLTKFELDRLWSLISFKRAMKRLYLDRYLAVREIRWQEDVLKFVRTRKEAFDQSTSQTIHIFLLTALKREKLDALKIPEENFLLNLGDNGVADLKVNQGRWMSQYIILWFCRCSCRLSFLRLNFLRHGTIRGQKDEQDSCILNSRLSVKWQEHESVIPRYSNSSALFVRPLPPLNAGYLKVTPKNIALWTYPKRLTMCCWFWGRLAREPLARRDASWESHRPPTRCALRQRLFSQPMLQRHKIHENYLQMRVSVSLAPSFLAHNLTVKSWWSDVDSGKSAWSRRTGTRGLRLELLLVAQQLMQNHFGLFLLVPASIISKDVQWSATRIRQRSQNGLTDAFSTTACLPVAWRRGASSWLPRSSARKTAVNSYFHSPGMSKRLILRNHSHWNISIDQGWAEKKVKQWEYCLQDLSTRELPSEQYKGKPRPTRCAVN